MKPANAPVIMLTVRGEEADKVQGLQLGADDYVTKPFSQRSCSAAYRRCYVARKCHRWCLKPGGGGFGADCRFCPERGNPEGKQSILTPTEHRLLYHLISNPGRVLTYETLLAKVWGYEYREEQHYVRLYVNYLRQKIEPDPAHPKYVLTEGLGYRFVGFSKNKVRSDPTLIIQVQNEPAKHW